MNDAIDKINNGYQKYDYLKDSVYINVFNLRFINNLCLKGYNNRIQLTLADDKLYSGKITLEYDDFNTMKKQYDELLELSPSRYEYVFSNTLEDPKTKIKIGEGMVFSEKGDFEDMDDIWNDYLSISYFVNFERKWDQEKNEVFITNKIKNYSIEIRLVDLRDSRLTRAGY